MGKQKNFCAVCDRTGRSELRHQRLFKFPNDPALKAKWVEFLEIKPEDLRDRARVCAGHFRRDQFVCYRLKAGAFPTIKLPTPEKKADLPIQAPPITPTPLNIISIQPIIQPIRIETRCEHAQNIPPPTANEVPKIVNVRNNSTVLLHHPLDAQEQLKNLHQSLSQLLSRNEFVDVTLNCQDGQVQAHRVVLASASSYIHSRLRTKQLAPSTHPVLNCETSAKEDMRIALNFIYTGRVQVKVEKLPNILRIARELGCAHLLKAVENAMQSCGSKGFVAPEPLHSGPLIAESVQAPSNDIKTEDTDKNGQLPIKFLLPSTKPSSIDQRTISSETGTGNIISLESAYPTEKQTFDFETHEDQIMNEEEEGEEEEMSISVVELRSLAEAKPVVDSYKESISLPSSRISSEAIITEEQSLSCPWCPQVFKSASLLQKHKRRHVGSYKPFECPHCPSTFAQSCHLKKHVRTHTGGGGKLK